MQGTIGVSIQVMIIRIALWILLKILHIRYVPCFDKFPSASMPIHVFLYIEIKSFQIKFLKKPLSQ